jgi:hypothetical protein
MVTTLARRLVRRYWSMIWPRLTSTRQDFCGMSSGTLLGSEGRQRQQLVAHDRRHIEPGCGQLLLLRPTPSPAPNHTVWVAGTALPNTGLWYRRRLGHDRGCLTRGHHRHRISHERQNALLHTLRLDSPPAFPKENAFDRCRIKPRRREPRDRRRSRWS